MNFLNNAVFENEAFIREWCLFHISLPKYRVYWRAAFIRGRFLKEEIFVKSVYKRAFCGHYIMVVVVLGGSHEIFTNREGGPTIFLLLPGGDKNLTESFIPFLPRVAQHFFQDRLPLPQQKILYRTLLDVRTTLTSTPKQC